MKKILLILALFVSFGFAGCDMLETKSEDKLSGDEFWNKGNAKDVESFLLSLYNTFRKATMIDCPFITFSGDMRCAPITTYSSGDSPYVNHLATNDMSGLRNRYPNVDDWRGGLIMHWKLFFEVVQEANILLFEIDKVPSLTSQEVNMFKAEAIFMRNLSYFFMVRAFGDVPYYTNAYNEDPLPRTDMLTVLQNCLNDLQPLIDNDPDAEALPWTYSSLSKKGIRASRGSVIALMMHINLWLVQFDNNSKNQYYQNVIALGEELERNANAYSLIEIERTAVIFRGGSSEGLFEIAQNINTKEIFRTEAIFSNNVSYSCLNIARPRYFYSGDFFSTIFPVYENDLRKELWFDENIYSNSNLTIKEIKKFWNIDTYNSGTITSNSGNQIVFRYADVLLLYAEALAALGVDDAKACGLLNQIRRRAHASDINASGNELMDAIFWERTRELIGEGHYYYDLVRTGKVYNRNYCANSMTRTNFNAGAWTWPIHRNALQNNTGMVLNLYWE
ncbi:MAG: RagB/SusD family nutrient uptake outer membrane protein [Dysgonamonadaceae bacterium]|jgi:hypothetical protein|nr:RagB/SusD family nutrient uptake outer membrane protein [Dysgonamonadaceae bacterium]